MRFRWKSFLALSALALVSVSAPSHAALTLESSRVALGGNDFIDWGVLGAPFTGVSNPFTIISNGGLSVGVSEANNSFERRDQGNGWAGDFAPGDHLIWTGGANGPVTLDFASPILGAGSQIQRDQFGAFTGSVAAYDSANTLLGSFNFAGNSTSNSDNSAIFVGVLSDSLNIKKLVYDVGSHDFALNQMDLVTHGGASPVPEPGSLALLATGGAPLLAFLRRRPRKEQA